MAVYPVHLSALEGVLLKGISSLAIIRKVQTQINESLARLIVAICECGSNSPSLFPGDEMFQSDVEESFTFIAHAPVKPPLSSLLPPLSSFPITFITCACVNRPSDT